MIFLGSYLNFVIESGFTFGSEFAVCRCLGEGDISPSHPLILSLQTHVLPSLDLYFHSGTSHTLYCNVFSFTPLPFLY